MLHEHFPDSGLQQDRRQKMKEANSKDPPKRGGSAPEPARKSVILPVIVLAALLVAGVAAFLALREPSPPPAPSAIPARTSVTPGTFVPPRRNTAAAQPAVATPSLPPDNRTPRELLASLAQIDGKALVTPDQAQAWKQARQQLVRLGPAAVPGIQEFLAQNQDTNYAGATGAGQLGFPSLRSGLINALAQIGGPEATDAMLQILQSSTIPSDIADLAKGMGDAATGQYQQEFLAAVRRQLFLAQQPQAGPDTDVGPLFQVLAAEAAGGAAVAPDIQQYGAAWAYYSAITLAHLPDGAGVPALAQMAQNPGAGQAIVLDSLAQMALANPQAMNTLLDISAKNGVSDSDLAGVAPYLAGRQFVLSAAADQIPAGTPVQTIHMAAGNQNFFSCQVSNPALADRQIALVDQLLQAVPPADIAAVQALREQKTALSAMTGKQP
jgi:hypothetical protein